MRSHLRFTHIMSGKSLTIKNSPRPSVPPSPRHSYRNYLSGYDITGGNISKTAILKSGKSTGEIVASSGKTTWL